MKICKKVNFVSLLLILLVSLSITAYAHTAQQYFGGMNRYYQEKPLWCWNASARMVADYRYDVTKSQTDVAKKIISWWAYDDDYGNLADMQQTASAINLYTDGKKKTGYATGSLSFDSIADRLYSSDNPVVLGIHYVGDDSYHAVACDGYYSKDKMLYWYDPKGFDESVKYSEIFDNEYAKQEGSAYFLDGEW